jgi:hypothetical protein
LLFILQSDLVRDPLSVAPSLEVGTSFGIRKFQVIKREEEEDEEGSGFHLRDSSFEIRYSGLIGLRWRNEVYATGFPG